MLTYSSGERYAGDWRDGKYHGIGTYTFPRGWRYVGEWWDGKYHGQGRYTLPSGEEYVGEWRDGKRNGQGTLYAANGSILESGRWEGDRLVQSSVLDTPKRPSDQAPASAPRFTMDEARRQCADLGFKAGTEAHGKCVLQLSR